MRLGRSARLREGSALVAALVLAGAFLTPHPAAAADPPVSARLTAAPGDYTVGDTVTLKLSATHPPGTVFEYPDAAGLMRQEPGSSVEPAPFVVEEVVPIAINPPAAGETAWEIRVRPFAPGEMRLPPLQLRYRTSGAADAAVETVQTEALSVPVRSVLASPDEVPADIKGAWRLPADWRWLALWILGAAILLAAAAWIYRRMRRRAPPPAVAPRKAPEAPAEPAWETAMRALEALLASRLLAQGRVKDFHVELSEIVKRFLGVQHRFDALDRTTAELMAELQRIGLDGALRDAAHRFLAGCDLVKFARHAPHPREIDETVEAARLLILSGRPVPAPREAAA